MHRHSTVREEGAVSKQYILPLHLQPHYTFVLLRYARHLLSEYTQDLYIMSKGQISPFANRSVLNFVFGS